MSWGVGNFSVLLMAVKFLGLSARNQSYVGYSKTFHLVSH